MLNNNSFFFSLRARPMDQKLGRQFLYSMTLERHCDHSTNFERLKKTMKMDFNRIFYALCVKTFREFALRFTSTKKSALTIRRKALVVDFGG